MKELKTVLGLPIALEEIFVPVLMEDMDKTAVQVKKIQINSRNKIM